MNLNRHSLGTFALAASAVAALALPATSSANTYQIDWLQYSTVAPSTTAPTPGLYAAPGVGPVNLSYTAGNGFTTASVVTPSLQNQSVTYGGDTFQWGAQEVFARTYLTQGPSGNNQSWSISYTFSNPLPANGQLVLGVMGLGARLPSLGEAPGGLATIATVYAAPSDYTQLGEYTPSIWNPTLINTITSPAPGFTMQNAFPGVGGQDPHWNTCLALTRFDAPLAGNTLTVHFDQTLGDGIGVNIGLVRPVPEPGTVGLLTAGLLGIACVARRRRSAST